MLKNKNAFTIVELLIVIVVIGILAAISTVSYNGIQNRSSDMSVKSDISNIAKMLELYKVDYGAYPIHTPQINSGVGSFKVGNQSTYAQNPQTRTNLTVCFSIDGSTIAIAAKSKSNSAFYAYSGNNFKVEDMSEENWTSDSDLAFERCRSISSELSPTRPNAGTYMNYNGYSISDTTTGPWRAWTRGE